MVDMVVAQTKVAWEKRKNEGREKQSR